MTLPTIVSYYSPRPAEYGDRAHAYDEPIGILEASCTRLGLRHVLLTEKGNEDAIPHVPPSRVVALDGTQDLKLMRAIVAGQLAYLQAMGTGEGGTIFVGVDCLFLKDPSPVFDGGDWDVAVTVGPYSPQGLNNGAVFLPPNRGDAAARFYAHAFAVCPDDWPGDQQAVLAVCAPLARPGVIADRNGLRVRFLSMDDWNLPPASLDDPGIEGATMLHFKGARKEFMAAAAEQLLGVPRPTPSFVVR